MRILLFYQHIRLPLMIRQEHGAFMPLALPTAGCASPEEGRRQVTWGLAGGAAEHRVTWTARTPPQGGLAGKRGDSEPSQREELSTQVIPGYPLEAKQMTKSVRQDVMGFKPS